MKNHLSIILVSSIILSLFSLACSDDDKVVNNDQPIINDRPDIPEPSTYIASVPQTSDEMIMEKVLLSNFTGAVDSAILLGCGPPWYDYPCEMYPIMPDSNRIKLVLDDTLVTSVDVLRSRTRYTPISWGQCWTTPLSSQPYLQLKRYWVRLGAPERYSGSTSRTTTRSTTRGVTDTRAEEFTKTLGIEATVSGSWFVSFSMTVKSEFSWSESHETSITEETSFTESFTITCPENKNLVYCVWQLVDEFSIVDSDGNMFTDPNYVFDSASMVTIIPTEDLVPVTTYFDL